MLDAAMRLQCAMGTSPLRVTRRFCVPAVARLVPRLAQSIGAVGRISMHAVSQTAPHFVAQHAIKVATRERCVPIDSTSSCVLLLEPRLHDTMGP